MGFLDFLRGGKKRAAGHSEAPVVPLKTAESAEASGKSANPVRCAARAATGVGNSSVDSSTLANNSEVDSGSVPTAQSENSRPKGPGTAGRDQSVPTEGSAAEPNVPTRVEDERRKSTNVQTVATDELARHVQGLHAHLDELKDQVLTPIQARIDDHEEKVLEQFQQLPGEIRQTSAKLFKHLQQFLPSVPPETRDILASLGNLSEGHKRIVNLFLAAEIPQELLSYDEIGGRLGLSPVTVRGYVADLRRLGFPFRERRAGRKVLIGVQEGAAERILKPQGSA